MFNKVDYSIVDTAAGFTAANKYLKKHDGTEKNYSIYDCKDGKCKQTSGYIKSNDDVIAFIGEGSEGHATTITLKSDNSCVNGENGKVLKDKTGICYATGKTILFENSESRYIILKGKAVARTPFEDNVNSVVIKLGAVYIVRDQFYTAGK